MVNQLKRKDLESMLKQKHQKVKQEEIMLKLIEDKEDKMELSALTFFRMMTDEDLISVAKVGRLGELCVVLTLDMNTPTNYISHHEA